MTNPFPDSDKTLYSVIFYDWLNPLAVSLDSNQDIGALISKLISSENSQTLRFIAGLVAASGMLFYVFKAADFRSSKDNILAGVIVGLIILSAWYTSSNIHILAEDSQYTLSEYYAEWDMLAEDDEGKPATGRALSAQSFTFINPIGQTYGYIKGAFDSALLTFGLI